MQLCDRGPHRTKRDVPSLDINHHRYPVALQGSRENLLHLVMVGTQFSIAIVRDAPGVRVVPEGAAGLAPVLNAPVGHGNVPVTLHLHLPDVSTSGEAPGGEDLWGIGEAHVFMGVADLGCHPLCCLEVIVDFE